MNLRKDAGKMLYYYAILFYYNQQILFTNENIIESKFVKIFFNQKLNETTF